LLDLNLPKLTGHELLTEIRAAGLPTPVIVVSSSTHPKDIQRTAEAGANAYVLKQAHLDSFSAQLQFALVRWIDPKKNASAAAADS